jgi:peroxiredoxin (alkyl hydroperoxide reductase subunit C)
MKGAETMMRWITLACLLLAPVAASAQVLGACGTPDAENPAAAPAPGETVGMTMPLPGDQAPNFQLPAVVGDEIKMVKLSDYDGMWRMVCFYPADFTFV